RQLDQSAVVAAGRNIIAGMVDCLPPVAGESPGGSVAGRLWTRLCDHRASPGLMRALSAALVLLADHELAASTLAARAAASVRAAPYAVVGTGLGPGGGHDARRGRGDIRGGQDGGLDRARHRGLLRARPAASPRGLHRQARG